MIVIKLGGSVVTDKSSYRTPRTDAIRRLCMEIKESGKDAVVVHGAGSYGHILAKENDINGGFKNPEQIPAAAKVCRDVRDLDAIVVAALIDAGIPAVSVPPGSCFILENRRLKIKDWTAIDMMMDKGIMPVTFGDVVQDTELGFSILSGDQLVEAFADRYDAERVIFVSDVDGVYDADPKTNKNAKLIERIDRDVLSGISTESSVADVTGGIRNKIETMMRMCKGTRDCVLVNGNAEGRLLSVLKGSKVPCTVIKDESKGN